jgi:acetyl esterase
VNTPDPEAKAVLDMISAAKAAAPPSPPTVNAREITMAWRGIVDGAAASQGPIVELADVSDVHFDHEGHPITLRIYRPLVGRLPVLLYLHGGGFVSGSIKAYDIPARTLAKETDWAVASVEYRLAPEHPYPAGLDDCYAALCHLVSEEATLNLDASRIVIIGDSAGGLLSAATALMARDRGNASLVGMICLYPNIDLRDDSGYASKAEHDGKIFSLHEFAQVMGLYLPGVDRRQGYVSPVLAEDLTGLPPSLIITCGCDPLRDEGEAFGDRLREAGVAAETVRLDGVVHGVLSMLPSVPLAGQRLLGLVKSFLARLHHGV